MLRRFKQLVFALVLLSGVVILLVLDRELNRELILPGDQLLNDGALLLEVERGQTLSALISDLEQRGILIHPLAFRVFVKLSGRENIRAGAYHLQSDDTPLTLLDRLERGDVVQYRITFPEGWTLQQWLAALAAEDRLEQQVTGLSPSDIAQQLGIKQSNPEGWFAANTYYFSGGDSDLDLLEKAHQAMQTLLADQWEERAEGLPYNSPYEALIMASIVERETGIASEREQIAGVFVRRLRKPMRLQTDPTVIYGLGERYAGNITRRHLREKTPYNTYLIDGLPPTPIANAGEEALRAALHPAAGSSLYFVAKGDGSHQFSATLAEHTAAVRRYQLAGRKRKGYRSSPVPSEQTDQEESRL